MRGVKNSVLLITTQFFGLFLKAKYYKSAVCLVREGCGPVYRFHVPVATFDLTGCYAVVARNVHGDARAVMSLQVFARGKPPPARPSPYTGIF